MNEENKTSQCLDEVLSKFSVLDFSTPTKKKPIRGEKTFEEIVKEFPVLDYNYGTVSYFASKYPMLPNEAYAILAEQFIAQKKPISYINDEQTNE